jgi:ankyrin repeat protein
VHDYLDRFGWNPLHYACAFSADNDELIQFLIEKNTKSVSQRDPYGRYPLHIACDSDVASLAVIQLLLKHDKLIVLKKTKYLEVRSHLFLLFTIRLIQMRTMHCVPDLFPPTTAYSAAHSSQSRA